MGRFRDALANEGLRAIAEVKRRSPSMGDLRPDADPAAIALAYERAGAAAVSILVDQARFGGSWDDLRAARAASSVPLLAKGFFSTAEHVRMAAEAGADAVLLLLRDLDDAACVRLMGLARDSGLDAFVEAHDAAELERAVALEANPIGINARDLSTFKIDRHRQLELVAAAREISSRHPAPNGITHRTVVAESGIWSRAQGAEAELAGADAILVGSALMKAPDPATKLAELISRPLVKVCGLTREEDVACAAEAGADLAGFILAETPRRAAAVLPVPDTMLPVAVFVGRAEETDADLVQLHPLDNGRRGREADLLWRGRPEAKVLDLPWLEDDEGHWAMAAERARTERVVLAGGLAAGNVRAAIETVRPWAVDAARSLELAPGIKDHAKVHAFVEAARQ
jgi:indole-3-glycerol phosphate synthase/phosphoribosylanthranilate isomerase/anthranilate synthase/indole-3-glycerol phosphate synthase/phosphoribosylanthranilate isomerase